MLAPFSKVGNGNVLWATAQIQHHNVVGNYNRIAPGVAFSGYVKMGNHCFVGTNATIKNNIMIEDYVLIGAGSYVSADIKEYEVVVPEKSKRLEGKSSFDFGH